jgi:hypothetical protein
MQQGEFRPDITRDTFDPEKGFSRVILQQGRVLLDADWNEQTSILLDYLRTLTADLLGPFAAFGDAFKIAKDPTGDSSYSLGDYDFWLGPGNCYIAGLRCQNEVWRPFLRQPRPFSSLTPEDGKRYLAYLVAWERHVTWLSDERLREVALGGPDTSTRAQVVWQVRLAATDISDGDAHQLEKAEEYLATQYPDDPGVTMRCQARRPTATSAPCLISPEARFRGLENQLYRVEVHRGGVAWDGAKDANGAPAGNAAEACTFKWSRDNGSLALPIRTVTDHKVRLASLGRDDRHTVRELDWVEIVDDTTSSGWLWQVADVDRDADTVTLKSRGINSKPTPYTADDAARHPVLRRWDHRPEEDKMVSGGILLTEGSFHDDTSWIPLEDGIEVLFEGAGTYREGDYWLVPARAAIGDVLWPTEADKAKALPPHGIAYHYAPLGFVKFKSKGKPDKFDSIRKQLEILSK